MLLPPVAFSHHCTCMHLCARDLHRSACHAPQPSVGTVVRTGEEEDPIAVMTVLNTVTHAAAPWARQVRAQLLAKCSQPAERDSLAKVCACMHPLPLVATAPCLFFLTTTTATTTAAAATATTTAAAAGLGLTWNWPDHQRAPYQLPAAAGAATAAGAA